MGSTGMFVREESMKNAAHLFCSAPALKAVQSLPGPPTSKPEFAQERPMNQLKSWTEP